MDLDHVKAIETALDRGLAAAICDVGVVDAGLGDGVDDDPAPIAGGRQVLLRAEHVERAAGAEPVVGGAREDHAVERVALGDQLRVATAQLDAGSLELHDHARIDREAAGGPGNIGAADELVAAHAAIDQQVLRQHVRDVPGGEHRRHVQRVDRLAELGAHPHEQTVD